MKILYVFYKQLRNRKQNESVDPIFWAELQQKAAASNVPQEMSTYCAKDIDPNEMIQQVFGTFLANLSSSQQIYCLRYAALMGAIKTFQFRKNQATASQARIQEVEVRAKEAYEHAVEIAKTYNCEVGALPDVLFSLRAISFQRAQELRSLIETANSFEKIRALQMEAQEDLQLMEMYVQRLCGSIYTREEMLREEGIDPHSLRSYIELFFSNPPNAQRVVDLAS